MCQLLCVHLCRPPFLRRPLLRPPSPSAPLSFGLLLFVVPRGVLERGVGLVDLHVAVILVRGVERLKDVLLVEVRVLGAAAAKREGHAVVEVGQVVVLLRRLQLPLLEGGGLLEYSPLGLLLQVLRHAEDDGVRVRVEGGGAQQVLVAEMKTEEALLALG